MVPPRWVDHESGRLLPVYTCPRPGCGRDVPLRRFRRAHLRLLGWRVWGEASIVSWCGHRQEFVVVPVDATWCAVVPVLGEAA